MSVKKVQSNSYVLKNCFRSVEPVKAVTDVKRPVAYAVNEHKTDFLKGYSEQVVLKKYPIDSEYVTSFAAGADYKTNPEVSRVSKANLGDITELQKLINSGDNASVILDHLRAKLSSVQSDVQKSETKEVKDNGTEV